MSSSKGRTSSAPWGPAQPHLKELFEGAQQQYRSGQHLPSLFNPYQQGAHQGVANMALESSAQMGAVPALNDFITGALTTPRPALRSDPQLLEESPMRSVNRRSRSGAKS